ncbi:ATP-binding cassette domain-containing protein [Paradevosia shaoguanensis]|uniref:ATP-binding cassette domain-containing protein n=1 Tax=Paradevosia shaoguanensis TaxID=1335043 RepID=A0AA41QJB2_9HYPH|nr:ATP-binding cassette domain-containing protein [Paradevosia shaoguanensis]MCF1741045.1 ATP-binding cassette domain-containing protein [Paradevosia shaoguanensis]MCI0125528.1 ATP-binding cassette domain-containing protein [Paradevosia shaoguanensis]
MADNLLVQTRDLVVEFGQKRSFLGRQAQPLRVLKGVNVGIGRGEIVGIVGESGSGKTTLGRALLGLQPATGGAVLFEGKPLSEFPGGEIALRRQMQMIFQDPMSSLNPRQTIGTILSKPILLHGIAPDKATALVRIAEVLDRVGLPQVVLGRYPHELSGGQRQRVGIARAVMLRPSFVLADEIVSGQDVSTQARVLQLLKELCAEIGMSMAFISHDLSVIRALCNRVYVLNGGVVVEEGECEKVFANPQHAYTRALIDAIPLPIVSQDWLETTAA